MPMPPTQVSVCGVDNDYFTKPTYVSSSLVRADVTITPPTQYGYTYETDGWQNGTITIRAVTLPGFTFPEGVGTSWTCSDLGGGCKVSIDFKDQTCQDPTMSVTLIDQREDIDTVRLVYTIQLDDGEKISIYPDEYGTEDLPPEAAGHTVTIRAYEIRYVRGPKVVYTPLQNTQPIEIRTLIATYSHTFTSPVCDTDPTPTSTPTATPSAIDTPVAPVGGPV